MRAAYDRTEQLMKFGQMVAFFEIFHAVIGMVKSNVFSTVIQVRTGRECVVCEKKVCIVWRGSVYCVGRECVLCGEGVCIV